jgi:hypothetical protein
MKAKEQFFSQFFGNTTGTPNSRSTAHWLFSHYTGTSKLMMIKAPSFLPLSGVKLRLTTIHFLLSPYSLRGVRPTNQPNI